MLLVNEALYTAISRAKSTCEMYVEDYSVLSKAIRNKDVTFSRFVIQACEYALNNIEDKKKDSK